ncbi:MAG TPA: DUF4388 domain-containing protein [Acidimicrobiales bacterium]
MALQGSLDTFALPDVLRLLATTAKTGRLRIDGDRGHGSVWLRDGTVMAAEADGALDDAPAEEVLFELLRFEEGSFAFDMDQLSPNGEQPEDVEILLRNAGALLTEWNELVSIVPSLRHRVRLVDSLPNGDVTVDARRWPALVAVASGETVGDVARTLGLSELGATRAVRDLVDLGIAEIEDPLPEGPSSTDEPTIPPASREDVPPEEIARRTPFGSLGSGESLATSVPRADTDGLPRTGWLQSPERPSGTAGDDTLSASGDRGPGAPANGVAPATPPAGTEAPRLGRSAAGSANGGSPDAADGSNAGSKRAGRSASGRAGRAAGRSSSSRPGSGRAGSKRGRAGAGGSRDASGESLRPPAGSGAGPNGDGSSRPGKNRPPSGPRRTPGPGRALPPDTGPLSMPPASPSAFDPGPLGPSPLPADTGQIRPVSPAAMPPDLRWAADDDAGLPPTAPFSGLGAGTNGAGNGMGNGLGNGRSNGGPLGGPPMSGTTPLDPNEVAPHVAAMTPEARAAVQGTVGNTGGAAAGLGPGEELAQRGQLLNFLSSVRP